MTELIFTAGFALVAAVLLCACSTSWTSSRCMSLIWQPCRCRPPSWKAGSRDTLPVGTQRAVREETEYFIRYFQPTGKGELRLEDGTVLLPNDLYPLPGETFRLYYKSLCTDQQTIDIYIVDSFNQTVTKSFSFNNETEEGVENPEQHAI